jgi:hypothetical protein
LTTCLAVQWRRLCFPAMAVIVDPTLARCSWDWLSLPQRSRLILRLTQGIPIFLRSSPLVSLDSSRPPPYFLRPASQKKWLADYREIRPSFALPARAVTDGSLITERCDHLSHCRRSSDWSPGLGICHPCDRRRLNPCQVQSGWTARPPGATPERITLVIVGALAAIAVAQRS